MQRIGLVLKRSEDRALLLGEKIVSFLHKSGKEVLLEPSCSELANKWNAKTSDKLTDEADLLVVLGGDGTILRAAALLNSKSMPVLGINLGRVGFMAEVSPAEAIAELESVMAGTAEFVKRMLLQITLPDGRTRRVLNDVVIHWGGIARLIDLGLRMGRSREIELRADGLIVSTPVGSSAYSYAASGPLVHPEIEGILLTPICPYAGLKRPLLIPPHLETELVMKKGKDLILTLDGHTSVALEEGQYIRIAQAPFPFIMVKSTARDYFDVLKEKLGLV
ncbi:MAG: NAD(+)/NADH kinase [Desulfomonilaceae bacterium]